MVEEISQQDISYMSESVDTVISTANDSYNILITGGTIFFGFFLTGLLIWFYLKQFKSKSLLGYIPTIWTSLGILGTFVTIVVRLSSITDYKDVTTLINNLAPAFWTSIIGISGAIVSSIAIKFIYAREEEEEFDELAMRSGGDVYKETPVSLSPELALIRTEKHNKETNKFLQQLVSLVQSLLETLDNNTTTQIEKLTEFYEKVFQSNKLQAEILTQEYLKGIQEIITASNSEISKSVQSIIAENRNQLSIFFNQELTKLESISTQIQDIIRQIPNSFDEIKTDLIDTVERLLIEKYQLIINGNAAFTTKLLEDVRNLENELSKESADIHLSVIEDLNKNISGYLKSLENSLGLQSNAIHETAKALSESGGEIKDSIKESSTIYNELVKELNSLIPALTSVVTNSDEYVKQGANTNQQLEELIKSVEQIVLKNQQLRYELMQWKRVHKKVKVNDSKGTKECPNCHEDNPIDANFCRKCAFGFWDCETIGSRLNEKN